MIDSRGVGFFILFFCHVQVWRNIGIVKGSVFITTVVKSSCYSDSSNGIQPISILNHLKFQGRKFAAIFSKEFLKDICLIMLTT